MNPSSETERNTTIERLAEAVSAQARAATRAWLSTLTVALVVLLPRVPPALDQPDAVQLPFNLGSVNATAFYPLAFTILAVLAVALASAHAQHMRVHRLAHGVVRDLTSGYSPSTGSIHPRDLFDVLTVSGLTRVAPLAQWIRGQYQFAESEASAPMALRMVSTAYYLVLKLLVFAVLYVLPSLALWHAYDRVLATTDGWRLILLSAAGLVAGLSLVVVGLGEAAAVWRIARLLSKGRILESLPKVSSR